MEVFVLWLALSIAVAVHASKRGRSGFGWFLFSVILSPLIGFVFLMLVPKVGTASLPLDELGQPITPETHVRCPDCRELVRKDARKCKHCGTPLIPQ